MPKLIPGADPSPNDVKVPKNEIDPNPEPITDPKHPDYCEPAAGVKPLGGKS